MMDAGCPPPKPPAIIARQQTPNPRVQRPVFRVQPARPVKPRPKLRTTGCSLPPLPAGLSPLLAATPRADLAGPGLALPWPELTFDAPGAGPERTFAAAAVPVAARSPGLGMSAITPPPIQPWVGSGVLAPVPSIPEPSTWALLALGVAGLLWKAKRP